jgi:hypothetical protein
VRQVIDPQHVHELVDVRLDSPRAGLVRIADDRHARDALGFGVAHRERIDIERPAAEERRDPVQNARLVFNVDGEGVQHGCYL